MSSHLSQHTPRASTDQSIPHSSTGGYIVVTVLIFTAIFIGLAMSLLGFVFVQHNAQVRAQVSTRAFQVAEAGLEYYKWRLSHYPNDFTNGTGEEGPYTHEVHDPEGGQVGTATLKIVGDQVCGKTTSTRIVSTGSVVGYPDVTETVYARYARPSVAEYAFIIDSNVWAGSDRVIYGPYHSNGGIRMDGENRSLVTSAQEEFTCTGLGDCDPDGEIKPGVFGDGPNDGLWKFPVPSVDFTGITLDLAQLEELAKRHGLRFHAAGGQSNKHGWHLVFKSDGTVDVYQVKKTEAVTGYSSSKDYHENYEIIKREQLEGNYDIIAACPVIFSADKLWIEGEIEGKITVAAAKTQPNHTVNVILSGNITYTPGTGVAEDGLTVISEGDISIPLIAPDDMVLNGIFVAQTGRFGRDHYSKDDIDSSREEYIKRNSLTMTGTIVSNGRVGTKWIDGNGNWVSGFETRQNSYDRRLAEDPPAFTPHVSEEHEFIEWREEN